jgi:hypothetical protein
MSKPSTLSGTTDTRTLSTSETIVLAVTVLGTLVAWLTGPHIPLPPLPHDVSPADHSGPHAGHGKPEGPMNH